MDASNKYCDDYLSAIFVKVHKVRLLSIDLKVFREYRRTDMAEIYYVAEARSIVSVGVVVVSV